MNKVFIIMIFLCFASSVYGLSLENIKLPPGFEISIYAEGVFNARFGAI